MKRRELQGLPVGTKELRSRSQAVPELDGESQKPFKPAQQGVSEVSLSGGALSGWRPPLRLSPNPISDTMNRSLGEREKAKRDNHMSAQGQQKTPHQYGGAPQNQNRDMVMKVQDKDTLFLRFALRYAKLGFRVFPVKPRSKEPLVKDWPNQATTDRKTIMEWWSKYPNANVAILTGFYEHGYFCVLDFDPRNGGDWFDDVDESILPPTCVVVTGGGGRHYYYLTNEPISNKKLKNGVDLKGAGGYVLAPPSIHPNGERYLWLDNEDMGLMPMGWLPDWAFFEAVGGDDYKGLWKLQPPIPQGTRHNYIVSLAGVLWNAGLTTEEIEKIIRDVIPYFETTADFDVEKEITRLIQDLPKWQKMPKNLNFLLKELPSEIRSIVIKHSPKCAKVVSLSQKQAQDNDVSGSGGKRKKEKPTLEDIKRVIESLRWVLVDNRPHIIWDGYLLDTEYIQAIILDAIGYVSKEKINAVLKGIDYKSMAKPYKGLILENKLLYGVADGIEGLWGHYDGKIYCYPVSEPGILVWDAKDAPKNVCIKVKSEGLPMIDEELLKDERQSIKHFLEYVYKTGYKLAADPRLVYSLFLPVFLGLGNAGFLLSGPAASGKSTFALALGYLEEGQPWGTPVGNNMRDHIAVLSGKNKTTYYDEMDLMPKELQGLLKSKITGSKSKARKLFEDVQVLDLLLTGSVVISTTGIQDKLKSDLLDRFFVIRFNDKQVMFGGELVEYIEKNHHKARAGVIALFRRAAQVDVPSDFLADIRFVDWARWAYRFATVLKVEDQFLRYIRAAKLESLRNSRFGFLVDFLTSGQVQEGVPYQLSNIFVAVNGLTGDTNEKLKHLYGVLTGNPAARNEIVTIARAAGYDVKIVKETVDKKKGTKRYVFIFNSLVSVSKKEAETEIEKNIEQAKAIVLGEKNESLLQNKENIMLLEQEMPMGVDIETGEVYTDDDDNNDDDGGGDGGGCLNSWGGDDDGGDGDGISNGTSGGAWTAGYEDKERVEGTDPWEEDYEYENTSAIYPKHSTFTIGYDEKPLTLNDVKTFVKEVLCDFLDAPNEKEEEAIQRLKDYLDWIATLIKPEDLESANEYIRRNINVIKMIKLLNGRKIELQEPYLPPSPKDVPVKVQPPSPPPPQSQPTPPKSPAAPTVQPTPPLQTVITNQTPQEPPNPEIKHEMNRTFIQFIYDQMGRIRRNGGKDKDVLEYLLKLREQVKDELKQKGLDYALFILEANIKALSI